jgi:hypothetical protein
MSLAKSWCRVPHSCPRTWGMSGFQAAAGRREAAGATASLPSPEQPPHPTPTIPPCASSYPRPSSRPPPPSPRPPPPTSSLPRTSPGPITSPAIRSPSASSTPPASSTSRRRCAGDPDQPAGAQLPQDLPPALLAGPAATAAAGTNLLVSSFMSPATNAVTSVPLGIVRSLPWINNSSGAAGNKTMLPQARSLAPHLPVARCN